MQRPKRSLGQNFLVDPNIQRKIVHALDVRPDEEILEIGPGHGVLTRLLLPLARKLVAVELDDQLARQLHDELGHDTRFTLIHKDILDTSIADITTDLERLVVVGNIPYNITTPILFHLLDRDARPARILLMVQKEVALRILAPAGSSDYGALSIGVQSVARVERVFHVGRGAFRPTPNVDSTVLRITPIRPFPLTADEEADLRSLTHATFQWRRKQLRTTLRNAESYSLSSDEIRRTADEAAIDLSRRPESLSPIEFLHLARTIRSIGLPRG